MMQGWLAGAHDWIKALHIAAVIFWIAGLFTLPRYLVYQSQTKQGSAEENVWSSRIVTLQKIVVLPAMTASWALGIALAINYGLKGTIWLQWKIAIVLILTGYYFWMASVAKRMRYGGRPIGTRLLRILNEVPAIAVITISVLVSVKPFS